MGRARGAYRSAAVIILLIAAFEFFGCALCSGDTCEFQGNFGDQTHQTTSSGDQCLCCCGHLLVSTAVHVAPSAIVTAAPGVPLPERLVPSQRPVYHPPRLVG